MKKYFLSFLPYFSAVPASSANAAFIDYFKDEQGETKWQYVANFSGSVFLLALLITSVFLLLNVLRAKRANKELKLIKENLEKRVEERTATLDQSNHLLQNANQMLQGEIIEHKETTSLLRSSEAYIKSILDSMPITLIGLDGDLNITQWNSWAEKATGSPLTEVLGRYLWDAYPTITLTSEQVQKVLETNKSTTIKLSQRGQYYFDITVYPVEIAGGTGIVILIDDVTQESKATNLLIQRDKFSAMGELASAMAHDINIPLQAIDQRVDHLISEIKGEKIELAELAGKLRESKENSNQASAIINHLIEFSNSESQTKQPSSVPNIIDHALVLAATMFSDTNGLKFSEIEISKSYADDLPSVPCHSSEIQQVCLSLLRHACYSLGKSTSTDKPKIEIEVSEFYDTLWIKLQHNGLGLSNSEQMTIFEPFYQDEDISDGCDMENRLSFPFYIVTEHHGGQMAVTSDLDIGTTFHIQLQLK